MCPATFSCTHTHKKKHPTPSFFLSATKTSCLSLCHPIQSLPPHWHTTLISRSFSPSKNTAAKIIVLAHQSHSSPNLSGIFCRVLSSSSPEPCPQGTPALFIAHIHTPNSWHPLDTRHEFPLCCSFPAHLIHPLLPPSAAPSISLGHGRGCQP